MKKRNFWAKCIAFLLVVVMVLSEQNITTLGETIGSYAQERMAGSSEQETERAIIKEDSSQESSSADGSSSSSSETSQAESSATQNDSQQTQQTGKNSDAGSAQTDQGTSAPSGQQALTNDASGADNADAQNEKKTADDKKNNRQNAQKKQKAKTEEQNDGQTAGNENGQDNGGNNGENTGDKSGKTFKDVAEENYGKNGKTETASVTFEQWDDKDKVYAGETVNFEVEYVLKAPAYYNYGNQGEPLFDTYDGTEIVLHLPEGLSIDESVEETLAGIDIIAPDDNPDFAAMQTKPNDWVLKFEDNLAKISVVTGDVTKSFLLPIKVDGNGTLEAGHIFNFGSKGTLAEIKTSFTIMDRTGATDTATDQKFDKNIPTETERVNEQNKLTSKTDDEWIIKKTAVSEADGGVIVSSDTVSSDKKTVTVKYDLEVGLKGEDGAIATEASVYGRNGRVPFDSISLTEIPMVTGPDGQKMAVQPTSITVTPNYESYTGGPITMVKAASGDSWNLPEDVSTLPVDTCAGKSAGDNVADSAPYRSTYQVEMVYDYAEFISHYYDPAEKQGQVTINNKAELTYTLKGLTQISSESDADQYTGEVTRPAQLNLQKMIVAHGNSTSKEYTLTNFPAGDPVNGAVTYTIQKEDGSLPQLYSRTEINNADGTTTYTYSKLEGKEGEPVQVSYDKEKKVATVTYTPSADNTTGQVSVWLDDGTYIVQETGMPANTVYDYVTVNGKTVETSGDSDNTAGSTAAAEITIAQAGTATAAFYNKEQLGSITMQKNGVKSGETAGPLQGAVFGLYESKDAAKADTNGTSPTAKATSNDKGKIVFDRLTYSETGTTYYVKEIQAPEDYRIDTEIYDFTISSANPDVTLENPIVNTFNLAPVKLQKYVWTGSSAGDNGYVAVNSVTSKIFNDNGGSFSIEKKIVTTEGKTRWEPVSDKSALTLGVNGDIETYLPVYDDNGAEITYRFKEILPESWHADDSTKETTETQTAADGSQKQVRVTYSEEFTLSDYLGKQPEEINNDDVIKMYNNRSGSIRLTKDFYEATSGGMQKVSSGSDLTATFALYYSTSKDGTDLQPYQINGVTVAETVQAGKSVGFNDLPRKINGEAVYYYLVETSASDGYAPSRGDKAKLTGQNQATLTDKTVEIAVDTETKQCPVYGPFNFTEAISTGSSGGNENAEIILDQTAIIKNVEQKVPLLVEKVNSYDDTFVPGAEYSVYEYEENKTTLKDYADKSPIVQSDGTKLENIDIINGGTLVKLEPGNKYIVIETTVPTGYKDVTTAGLEENDSNPLIVDLTDITEGNVDTDEKKRTVRLRNQPDPKVQITKTLVNADGSETTLNGVEFTVYTKTQDGTFTPATIYGQTNYTITSGTSGNKQLPAGEYYLKEDIPEGNPNNILDPSEPAYSSLYPEKVTIDDKEVKIGERAEDGFYFGPYPVTDSKDIIDLGTIKNYSNKGAVTVTKKGAQVGTDDLLSLAGAEFTIYKKVIDDQNKEQLVNAGTATSGSDGKATFSNLDIYDTNGQKITYVIEETTAPTGYTASEEELTVTLKPEETVTKGTNGAVLEIVNQPVTSFTVNKVYYNMWEHEFTQKEYELPGTVIALYEKTTDENGNVSYEYKDVKTTNEDGSVTFNNLEQAKEYVAIEVRVPDGEEYQYLEPKDYQSDGIHKKVYLKPDYDPKSENAGLNNLPQTISGNELDQYYYVTKEANNTGKPENPSPETLVNVENWAQLQIRKFVTDNKGSEDESQREINNAQFDLYMQVVNDGIEPNENGEIPLAYTEGSKNYKLVGSYSSGTLYDENGKRMDGWFGTDILKSADNVVYWLVEREAGIGAKIDKANVVTLIKRHDTSYVNATTGYQYVNEDGETITCNPNNVLTYEDNTVSKREFENIPVDGDGGEMYSTVRIAKWAGSYDNKTGTKNKEYTPLGNAVFELLLVDSSGRDYKTLDTLTTGLDNDTIGQPESTDEEDGSGTGEQDETQDKPLTSWASSKAFSWSQMETIKEELAGQGVSEETLNDIFRTDDEGNHYVRVMIKESKAPSGYWAEKNTFYMYMFFQNKEVENSSEGTEYITTEIFNDAYYVTGDHNSAAYKDATLAENQPDNTWAFYPTREGSDGQTYALFDGNYTAPDDADGAAGKNAQQYRLVNWPVDRQPVTVQKYGYEVREGENSNLNMTSEELNDYYNNPSQSYTDRVPLQVTMRLERYMNGKWQAYAYSTEDTDGKFTTNARGYFAFPDGLPRGTYRIIEDPTNEQLSGQLQNYENIYDGKGNFEGGSSTEQKEAAYYFTVSGQNVHITMYNPKKLSLTVKKTDMSGDPVNSFEFTLSKVKDANNQPNSSKPQENTGTDGTATFDQLDTGTYKLDEALSSTYSKKYFGKYFEKMYASYTRQDVEEVTGENLGNMVNGNGIFLGYTRSLKTGPNGTSVQITKKTDLSDYRQSTGTPLSVLTVENPVKDDFQIKKTDTDTLVRNLPGAKFDIYYVSFDQVVEDDSDIFGTATPPTPVDIIKDSNSITGWTKFPGSTTDDSEQNGDDYKGGYWVTGEDGIIQISNADPGIYQITEREAPTGYNKSNTTQYIVLTGGLNIGTVTIDGASIKKVEPDTAETGTTGVDTANTDILTFTNEAQVTLTVSKTINDGNDGNVKVPDSQKSDFTFELYGSTTDAGGKIVVNTNDVRTAKDGDKTISAVGDTTTETITFTGLTRGETYFLKETSMSKGFALNNVTINTSQTGEATGDSQTAGTAADNQTTAKVEKAGEYYKITLPDTSAGLSITADNTYLYGQVSIMKVDGADGTRLSGAAFEVYRDGVKGTGTLLNDVDFEEEKDSTGKGTGIYTAKLLLTSISGNTFYIYEKSAPDNYLPDESSYIKVTTLTPGQVADVETKAKDELNKDWSSSKYATSGSTESNNEAMLGDYIFPNYKGANIELVKYDNVRAAKNSSVESEKPAPLNGVTFTLYQRTINPKGNWSRADSDITGTDGKIQFLVNPDMQYALAEESTGLITNYQGLEGIYSYAGGTESDSSLSTETVSVDGQDKTLYLLNNNALTKGETYAYNAYNIPYVNLEIRKFNALEPSNENVRMTAKAALYDVTDVESFKDSIASDEDVENFLAGTENGDGTRTEPTAIRSDIAVNNKTGQVSGESGIEYYSFATVQNVAVAGRTYLVVETEAAGSTLIKDNKQVQWYDLITVPAGSRTAEAAVLKNVQGSVSSDLAKEVVDKKESYTSLFTEGTTVQYTIKPTVNSNKYPLSKFVVRDEGLTAYNGDTELSGYMKDHYSLTEVTVGQATHDTKDYADGNYPIMATVTFIGSDAQGQETVLGTPQTLDVSSQAQTFSLPADAAGKAEKVEISYASEGFKKATTFATGDNTTDGYVLGTDFKPGAITVTAVLDQQGGMEPDGKTPQKAITKVRNKTTSMLEYYTWTSGGQRVKAEPIPKESTADITFAEQQAAKVSITKTAGEDSARLGENISYTITLKNAEDAGAAMEDPYLVDFLPQGTTFVAYGNEDKNGDGKGDEVYLDAGDTGITLGSVTTMSQNGENAVRINLDGSLQPGKSVQITLIAKVENAATSYGASIINNVIAGSDEKGVVSDGNALGASFKNASGQWPGTMSSILADLQVDTNRINTFEDMLGNQSGDGVVAAQSSVNWTTQSDMVLVKSAKGNADTNGSYSTNALSTVTNDANGAMNYRLSLSNTSALYGRTGISVIDILPTFGDYTGGNTPRESVWGLTFGSVDNVSVITQTNEPGQTSQRYLNEGNEYKVYYYIGKLTADSEEIAQSDEHKMKYSDVYDDVMQIDFNSTSTSLPTDWTAQRPADITDVTAFIVAVNPVIALTQGTTLVVDYTAKVNGGAGWDDNRLNEYSWQNTVNSFSAIYKNYKLNGERPENAKLASDYVNSNQVSGTIVPGQVKVGGHIWIDKDGDGVWEDGESVDNFVGTALAEQNKEDVLIKNLLNDLGITLYSYDGDSGTAQKVGTYDKSADTNWLNKAYFEFGGLMPSMLLNGVNEDNAYKNDIQPDTETAFGGGLLDVTKLKGTSPKTYRLGIDIPEDAGDYEVTDLGETTGKSRDPQLLMNPNTITDAALKEDIISETKDNNFRRATVIDNTVESEQFYLWSRATDVYDQTKDLGIVPLRDLKIVKTAADSSSTKLENVSLTVYGPFSDKKIADGITEADLTNGTTIMTNSSGEALFTDLLRFQNYVIMENSTVPGYELDNATATGGTGTNIEQRTVTMTNEEEQREEKTVWILKSPSPSITTSTETVTVTNEKIPTKVTLKASKTLENKDLGNQQFTFKLWDGTTGMDAIGNEEKLVDTKKNNASGEVTFEELSFNTTGSHTYYITEELHADSKGANPYQGITYDTSIYEVTVNVSWNPDDSNEKPIGLTSEVTYKKLDNQGNVLDESVSANEVKFTNIYGAIGSWTPEGTKTLTGRDMKEGETYTFSVREVTTGDGQNTGDDTATGETTVPADSTGSVTGGTDGQPSNITFTPINYTLDDVGTHTYTIVEDKAGQKIAGVTYDNTTYTVEVTVEDNGDGTLDPHVTYKVGDTTANQADFTNIYEPTPITYKPYISKTLTGHELPVNTENKKEKTFTFSLSKGSCNPEDGVQMPSTKTLKIPITKESNADASVVKSFGDITFTKAGTYSFTINEVKTNEVGVTYDETIWTVTVEVTDDKEGNLTKTVTYTNNKSQQAVTITNDTIPFTNNYQPTSIEVPLSVSKAVEGANMPKPQTFTFKLSMNGQNEGSVIIPQEGITKEVTVSQTGEEYRETVRFAPITFTKAGTYTFKIEETATLPDGYTMPTPTRYVQVVVSDNNGALQSSVTYYMSNPGVLDGDNTASRFTNNYQTVDVDFAPKVIKTLNGDIPAGTKEFQFKIENISGDKTGFSITNADCVVGYTQTTGNKEASFEPITFTKAGEYKFRIEEISTDADGNKGYTYDDSKWILTVNVVDDPDDNDNHLKATGTYVKEDGSGSNNNAASFTNYYDVTPDTYAPQVKKTITGADIPTGREDEFDFTLTYKDAESAYVGEDVTGSVKYGSDIMAVNDVKNLTMTGSGESSFEELTFTKAGTYTFEIAETSGNQPGYKYDSSKWTLTVNVVDENGELKATPSYTKAGDSSVTHATFTNTYSVTPDTFTPQVEKQFSDDSVTRPTAKDFTFKLTADEQNPAGGAFTGYDETTGSGTALEGANTIETKVNGSGTGAFDTITFTKAGTYNFRIQEEAGSDLGYTYDDAVWTLTVQVDDIGGALQVTNNDVTYQSNDTTVEPNNEKAVFVNEYHYISSIIINKEVLRGNAVYETDDVFYAGIFRKVDNTGGGTGSETGNISYEIVKNVVVDNKTVESGVVQLANNDSVEVYVPLGGEDQTEAITYYVFETDAKGHPLVSFDEDGNAVYNQSFAYEISSESTGKDETVNGRGEVYVTPDTAGAHPEVTITNRATSVSIEKRDISGNPLTGAFLELWKQSDSVDVGVDADADRTKAANGDILLDTWTSDGTPHELTAELAVGGTYYLREAEVPAGYVQAADILFTVENGDPITLVMEDENQAGVLGQIQVTKRLSAIDETTFDNIDLVAEDATVYVGLFTDAQGEHPYGEDYVKEIHIQDASSGTVTFDNLPSGTYYVFETQQDGTVIPYGELQADAAGSGAGFICAGDGSNGGVKEITLNPDTGAPEGSTELGNVYYGDLPDGFAYQGELMITKAVMKDGAPADSSDTFYAGIFTSETETVPYKVVALKNNGTVTVEVPLGGENGMDPVTYYIYETDADGNKIDKNSFAYTVSGEGTVDLDVDNTTAGRTIINTMASDPDTTRTIREKNDSDTKKISTDTSKKSTGTNRRTSSSKTGDDTRVGLYLLFFAAAAVGIILTLRKRKEDKPE